MKNKLLIIILSLSYFFLNSSYSEELNFESSQIEILEDGNLIKAKGGVKIFSSNDIEIEGNESIYNKEESILNAIGGVVVNDRKNDITIKTDEIIYNKEKEIISAIKETNQVIVNDRKNDVVIDSDKIVYDNKRNIISFTGNTLAKIKNKYQIKSTEIIHDRNLMEIYSSKKTTMKDKLGNVFHFESFKLNTNKNLLKAKKVSIFDNQNNKYFLDNVLIDLENYKIAGNNISIDFDNPIFGNSQNEPRLKGKSIYSNLEESTIYKGIFTTCKKNDDKWPA